MIQNAANVPLNQSGGVLPNMATTIMGWFQNITFTLISKSIVAGGQLVESETSVSFQGVRQPFTPEQLMLKPIGERSWAWETIHALPDLILTTDDRMVFFGVKYRVMQKLNWKEYGFVEYHIVQDWETT